MTFCHPNLYPKLYYLLRVNIYLISKSLSLRIFKSNFEERNDYYRHGKERTIFCNRRIWIYLLPRVDLRVEQSCPVAGEWGPGVLGGYGEAPLGACTYCAWRQSLNRIAQAHRIPPTSNGPNLSITHNQLPGPNPKPTLHFQTATKTSQNYFTITLYNVQCAMYSFSLI